MLNQPNIVGFFQSKLSPRQPPAQSSNQPVDELPASGLNPTDERPASTQSGHDSSLPQYIMTFTLWGPAVVTMLMQELFKQVPLSLK